MNTGSMPLNQHQSVTAQAMNYGPLSNLTKAGSLRAGHDTVSVDRAVTTMAEDSQSELVDDLRRVQYAAVDGDIELEVE